MVKYVSPVRIRPLDKQLGDYFVGWIDVAPDPYGVFVDGGWAYWFGRGRDGTPAADIARGGVYRSVRAMAEAVSGSLGAHLADVLHVLAKRFGRSTDGKDVGGMLVALSNAIEAALDNDNEA